ncbi:MAG: T9SS type A sorting domain-containing protein [candidate division WOR-3 bacterium]|nr:T9SS type A sorting domain-containing protein [candidate division WOR-3 bacterium]MDW8150946.1 T9SS type A sorting domain-containing protein [candidate division WOR-3 bacterium]
MLFVISVQMWSGLRTFGGANWDQLWGVDFNAPGNRVVSNLFSMTYKIDNSTGSDFVVIVTTPFGTSIWERVVGRSNMNEWSYKITYDNAGNPIVGGVSCVPSGGPSNCQLSGSTRAFAIKLNGTNGSFLSARDIASSWGTADWVRIMSINSTSDGGFVVAGDVYYDSWTGDIDGFVAKFDANMNLQWARAVGTTSVEWLTTAFQTTDGNIVVIGPSFYEIWVAKFNVSNGNTIWQRRYPRTYYDDGVGKYFTWGKPASDGGIIIADEISGGNNRDVLFLKLNSNGDFVCARRIGGTGHDAGIDIVEGADYYYLAGFWNSYDLFYARFDKTNCNLVGNVRYILSGNDESARAIDIRSSSNVPYVAGYTNRPDWTAGNYDGLLAADSGIQDTCYWRSLTPSTNVSVSLSASGSWDIYGNPITVSSATYTANSVNTNKTVACGLLTPVNTSEKYEDCYISISRNGKFLNIRSKNKQDIDISIYSVDGRLVYKKEIKNFEGEFSERLSLLKGIYVVSIAYIGGRLIKQIVVK